MHIKDYFYQDFDGIHYPDARKGTKYTYGVNFEYFLDTEKGKLNGVEWSFDEGLNGKEHGMHPDNKNIALALIHTPCVGTYTVKCTMTYTAVGINQHIVVPLEIKVV